MYVVSVVLAIEVGQRARVEERVSGLFLQKQICFPVEDEHAGTGSKTLSINV